MTDSIYNERVCPICKEWIWKWDKKCSKCYPKKKKQGSNKEFIANGALCTGYKPKRK